VNVLTYLAGIAIERARSEEERCALLESERAARSSAEEAVRARDQFLSIASHELRTPVTVVKGVSQMMQRSLDRGRLEQVRLPNSLSSLQRASDRLVVLIDDLLDVSRLQTGRMELRLGRHDVVQLVRDLVAQHTQQLDSAYTLEALLPDTEVPVHADSMRLEQVLDNLLTNAIKYSPDGGTIRVSVERADGGVTVSVQDSGIGLPPGMEESIFEPFGRATNALTRNLPGMGLGLFISRRIAELHGGRLWAESAGEDRGTTMQLWLPYGNDIESVPVNHDQPEAVLRP
jgi:signal transduction histidine kinase